MLALISRSSKIKASNKKKFFKFQSHGQILTDDMLWVPPTKIANKKKVNKKSIKHC